MQYIDKRVFLFLLINIINLKVLYIAVSKKSFLIFSVSRDWWVG